MLVGLAAILALVVSVQADDRDKDKKEQTLKGTITCAKCDLKVKGQTKCATVIKVTDQAKDEDKGKAKAKETVYYFDTDADKEYHSDICKKAKKGKVTGTVSEKEGKKYIKVSKVEYEDKKEK